MSNLENGLAVVWAWLRTPLSGSLHHEINVLTAWHGRLMVLSWGILAPLGIGVARYYKITRRQNWPGSLDNKFWWKSHRFLLYGATLCMTIGVVLIALATQGFYLFGHLHASVGWAVVLLGWMQIGSALARGSKGGPAEPDGGLVSGEDVAGDHYNMTRRRRTFEYVHKGGGYLATLLAAASTASGLILADSPRWMPAVILCWWTMLACAAVRLQRQGRCIDTYQAIWGPSDIHPGNNVRAIGWGIGRRSSPSKNNKDEPT